MKTLTTIIIILDLLILVWLFGKSFIVGLIALIVFLIAVLIWYTNEIAKVLDELNNIQ